MGSSDSRSKSEARGEQKEKKTGTAERRSVHDEQASLDPEMLTDRQLLACAPIPKPWPKLQFTACATLQMCPRNHGRVSLMEEIATRKKIVVKQMPLRWTGNSVDDFLTEHPDSLEVPWMDMGITCYLNKRGFPNCIETIGAFRDEEASTLCYAMEYAEGGDLYSFLHGTGVPAPGPKREEFLLTPVAGFLGAIEYLHLLGIGHGDISLENVLISHKGEQLRVIDFGMATTVRLQSRARGKPSYRAPEVFFGEHDMFKTDAFSCGVVLYALALSDYPWLSTQQEGCKCFEDVRINGFRAHLKKRRLRGGKNDEVVIDVLSEALLTLIGDLVSFRPEARPAMTGDKDDKDSVWSHSWLSTVTSSRRPGTGLRSRRGPSTPSAKPTEKVPTLPAFTPQTTTESAYGTLEWNTRLSSELQKSVDHIFKDKLYNLRFSCTIADPREEDCPIVAMSTGFSDLTGYGVDEVIGRNCRFLLDGVPPSKVDNKMRMMTRQFCQTPADGGDATYELPFEVKDGEKPITALPKGELFVVQWNQTKSGELFQTMFYLKKVTLDNAPFIVGLQMGSSSDNVALQTSFRSLSDNMSKMEQMLASQFWYSAPMRRQRRAEGSEAFAS